MSQDRTEEKRLEGEGGRMWGLGAREETPSRRSGLWACRPGAAGRRAAAQRLVSNVSYGVLSAERGAEAPARLRAGAPPVDLLLTDTILPDHGGHRARPPATV